jgi:hypothetical protein
VTFTAAAGDALALANNSMANVTMQPIASGNPGTIMVGETAYVASGQLTSATPAVTVGSVSVAVGDSVYVFVQIGNDTSNSITPILSTVASVADTQGNAFTKATSTFDPGLGYDVEVWYTDAIPQPSTMSYSVTVTADYPSGVTTTYMCAQIVVLSNTNGIVSYSLDSAVNASGTQNDALSALVQATVTTSSANDVLFLTTVTNNPQGSMFAETFTPVSPATTLSPPLGSGSVNDSLVFGATLQQGTASPGSYTVQGTLQAVPVGSTYDYTWGAILVAVAPAQPSLCETPNLASLEVSLIHPVG